ncbi:unnamed protein product [Diamesa serratosioi]
MYTKYLNYSTESNKVSKFNKVKDEQQLINNRIRRNTNSLKPARKNIVKDRNVKLIFIEGPTTSKDGQHLMDHKKNKSLQPLPNYALINYLKDNFKLVENLFKDQKKSQNMTPSLKLVSEITEVNILNNKTSESSNEVSNYIKDNNMKVVQRLNNQETTKINTKCLKHSQEIEKDNMIIEVQRLMEREIIRNNLKCLNHSSENIKDNVIQGVQQLMDREKYKNNLNNNIIGLSNDKLNYVKDNVIKDVQQLMEREKSRNNLKCLKDLANMKVQNKDNLNKVVQQMMELETYKNNLKCLKNSTENFKVDTLNNKLIGLTNDKLNNAKKNLNKVVQQKMDREKFKNVISCLKMGADISMNDKYIEKSNNDLINDVQRLMDRERIRNSTNSEEINKIESVKGRNIRFFDCEEANFVKRKTVQFQTNSKHGIRPIIMGKDEKRKLSSAFALSKCFIAPAAKDFPMPSQKWLDELAESVPIQHVAVKTLNDINMNTTPESKRSTKCIVTSTPKDANYMFSFNLQIILNIRTNLFNSELSIIEHV